MKIDLCTSNYSRLKYTLLLICSLIAARTNEGFPSNVFCTFYPDPSYPPTSLSTPSSYAPTSISCPQDCHVSFWYHMFGRHTGTLKMSYQLAGSDWVEAFSLSGEQDTGWNNSVTLIPYSSSLTYYGFRLLKLLT